MDYIGGKGESHCGSCDLSSLFGMLARKDVGSISHDDPQQKVCLQYHVIRSGDQSTVLQVVAFCDVVMKKINKGFYIYEESDVCIVLSLSVYDIIIVVDYIPKPKVPIIHFKEAHPPLLICVKWVSSHVICSMWLSDITVVPIIIIIMYHAYGAKF